MDFDGVDDLINIASDTDFDSTVCTITFWIKFDTLPSTADAGDFIIGRHDSASSYNGVTVTIRNDVTLGLGIIAEIKNASAWVGNVAFWGTYTTGTWYFVAIGLNGTGTPYIYVDNVAGDVNTPTAWTFNNQAVRIGTSTDTYWTKGDFIITEVTWHNTLLTTDQLTRLYNSKLKSLPLQITLANLKLYLPLDSSTHGNSADLDTAWDLSGNGNNGNPDNGANNTGLTWAAETVLNYPSPILQGQ